MRKHKTLAVFMAGLLLASCASRQKTESVTDTGTVEAEYDRLEFEQQGITGAVFVFRFEVNNSTFNEKNYDTVLYSFKFDGKKVEDSSAAVNVTAPPRGNNFFNVSIKVDYPKDVPSLSALLKKRSTTYEFTGTLKGAGGELPLKAEYEVGLPELPTVTVPGASIATGGGGEVGFTFDIFINNSNVFGIKIDYLNYGLEIDGVPVGTGRTADLEKVPPNSQLAYTFPAKLDLKTYSGKVREMMAKKSLNWTLSGVLSVEGVEIPVRETGVITFTR
jgi:LEA14-like dessication related protein